MKLRGSSIRFVVVSATVPNIEDVANWIGDSTLNGSATTMQVCIRSYLRLSDVSSQLYYIDTWLRCAVRRRVSPVQTHEDCVRYSSQERTKRLRVPKNARLQVIWDLATALREQAHSGLLFHEER